MLHELSHRFANTRDLGYLTDNRKRYTERLYPEVANFAYPTGHDQYDDAG